ncbi:hypothetical protein SPKIRA_36900 (plasmid) [Sphingomonas paucimobilis]|uniref:hypothetical protein n=1 Tax=Sphingomonas paucimobilis TaxID=13689 RepID=UPI0015DC6C31|nr:hypothetical protein [Sphingomonas paucimobilis]BCI72860.1 hypothetical protein SPKIRA_36900 [Sphingomonas paucimobilis]
MRPGRTPSGSAGQLSNAGTITGDVDLGYASFGGRSYNSAIYTNSGGTLTGNLRFGDGSDVFVEMDGQTGVTGTIDGAPAPTPIAAPSPSRAPRRWAA